MYLDEEFRPNLTPRKPRKPEAPGPLQAGFRAYTEGGRAGLTKFLEEQEAKAQAEEKRNSLPTPTTKPDDGPRS